MALSDPTLQPNTPISLETKEEEEETIKALFLKPTRMHACCFTTKVLSNKSDVLCLYRVCEHVCAAKRLEMRIHPKRFIFPQ